MLASTIIDRAEEILQDTDNDRWSAAEHLGALNDGQRAICVIKPDAYVINEATQLSAGIKQTLPSGGTGLINAPYSMGADSSTLAKTLDIVDMEHFGNIEPSWVTETTNATPDVLLYDEKDPLVYYCYPPQPSSSQGYIQLIYSKTPTDVSDTTASITLADIYETALVNYILFRAYSKETDAMSIELARSYHDAFLTELGMKEQAEKRDDPNKR